MHPLKAPKPNGISKKKPSKDTPSNGADHGTSSTKKQRAPKQDKSKPGSQVKPIFMVLGPNQVDGGASESIEEDESLGKIDKMQIMAHPIMDPLPVVNGDSMEEEIEMSD